MWKNVVERHRRQMIKRRMRLACLVTKTTDTLTIRNTYCFSNATMVSRTRLNITLYVHCLFFFPLFYKRNTFISLFKSRSKYLQTHFAFQQVFTLSKNANGDERLLLILYSCPHKSRERFRSLCQKYNVFAYLPIAYNSQFIFKNKLTLGISW
jgi:hypothetical protein